MLSPRTLARHRDPGPGTAWVCSTGGAFIPLENEKKTDLSTCSGTSSYGRVCRKLFPAARPWNAKIIIEDPGQAAVFPAELAYDAIRTRAGSRVRLRNHRHQAACTWAPDQLRVRRMGGQMRRVPMFKRSRSEPR